MKNRNTTFIAVLLVSGCFGLLPGTQAVVPPPDGGYPGFNTAEGQKALFSLTTGVGNTAVGWYSLFSNTDGSFNTAVGAGTLLFDLGDQSTGEGIQNTAVGTAALLFNTTGAGNTAFGTTALLDNTTGNINTAVGDFALTSNSEGGGNVAVGRSALGFNTTGSLNVALGVNAGLNLTTGDNNVCIGTGVAGNAGESNTTRIRNIYGTTIFIGATLPVLVSDSGQLGTMSSSRRFKHDIESMDEASEAILALKPVTFHYKSDKTNRPEFGLIAEDVAEVNPNLVVRDKSGEIYTVRYDAVNAMLLNEFLKEHRKNEEQEATIARQQKQVETLTAGLQKVTAQLELIKFATGRIRRGRCVPHIVSND